MSIPLNTIPKRVTIRDLARELGISDRSVSAALNPHESKVKLGTETLERVRQLATARNYRPDTSARSMRSGKFYNIGYFEASLTSVHYPLMGVEAGICDAAQQVGYRVVLVRLPTDLSVEHNVIPSVFSEAHLDALIVTHLGHLPPQYKEALDSSSFPIVYLNEKQPRNAVYVDDEKAAEDLTSHAISMGYRKIIFTSLYAENPHYSHTDRQNGYVQAMKRAGLEPVSMMCPDDWKTAMPGMLLDSMKNGAQLYVCQDDLTAMRVFKTLYQNGMLVPRDVSIATFGDGESPMELTAMRLPFYEMARSAVSLCMELIKKRPTDGLPSRVHEATIYSGETVKEIKV